MANESTLPPEARSAEGSPIVRVFAQHASGLFGLLGLWPLNTCTSTLTVGAHTYRRTQSTPRWVLYQRDGALVTPPVAVRPACVDCGGPGTHPIVQQGWRVLWVCRRCANALDYPQFMPFTFKETPNARPEG